MSAAQNDNWRSTVISVFGSTAMLVAITTGAFLSCGGLGLGAIAAVLAVVALAYFHYLWWGESLNREVSDQRKALMDADGEMPDA